MTPIDERTFVVRPYYRQFYLRRGEAEWSADQVPDEGYEQGLHEVDGFVYVATTMYGSPTTVTICIFASAPPGAETADRSAEIVLGGHGDLEVLNWEPGDPPAGELAVPAGQLRLRATWYGMSEALAHPDADVAGDDASPERIMLDVWPVA